MGKKSLKARYKKQIHRSKMVTSKSLSLAAITGLALFGLQVGASAETSLPSGEGSLTGAAADINPADYLEDSYGAGNSVKYFKFVKNTQGNYEIKSTTSEDCDFSVNYNSENPQSRLVNTEDLSSQDIEGSFINLSSDSQLGVAIENTGNNAKLGNIIADFVGNEQNKLGPDGIIYNGQKAHIESINSQMISNTLNANKDGGIIYNEGIIGSISGLFVDNDTDRVQTYLGTIHSNGGEIKNIEGIFIGEHISEMGTNSYRTYGNTLTFRNAKIGKINGTYIGNYHYSGGYTYGAVIENTDSTIESIDGTYIGNYVYGNNARSNYGGVLYNTNKGTIDSIKGEYLYNYVTQGSYYNRGGAFDNRGTINSIDAKFIGNYIEECTSTNNEGGAIHNQGTMKYVTGEFRENYIDAYQAHGGAIYNNGATIGVKDAEGNLSDGIVNVNFTGNYTKSTNSSSLGGAIYNSGTLNILNSNFTDNHAISNSGTVNGGAIWTSTDVNITADNGTSIFKDNYIQKGSNSKINQAIYVSSSAATITFDAKNNGTISLYDIVDGVANYNVKLTGDESGTINLYNDVNNANVTADSVNINIANDDLHDYTFKTLTSSDSANWVIDVDVTNQKSDTISTTAASAGTVLIDKLNLLGGSFDNITDENFKIQILKTQDDNLQLALSDEVKAQIQDGVERLLNTTTTHATDELKLHTNWDDIYASHTTVDKLYGTMGLATTDTTNDSIGISNTRTESTTTDTPLGDTLAIVNQANLDGRTFDFDSAGDVYTVTADLGTTGTGKFTINGVSADDGSKSTMDFDGHSGMNITKASDVVIKDVEITKAGMISNNGSVMYLNNENAKVSLENVHIHDVNNTSNSSLYGGVIRVNKGELTNISGTFENNTLTAKEKAYCSVIDIMKNVKVGNINADFINNTSVSSFVSSEYIGAEGTIGNIGEIESINGLFKGNASINNDNGAAYAGAIINEAEGTIGSISGKFEDNYAESHGNYGNTKFAASSGAIENRGLIDVINADFTNNYAKNTGNNPAVAGAICNSKNGIINIIEGDFEQNYTYSTEDVAHGGAIYNQGKIPVIKGNFSENHIQGASAGGGAIYNFATIDDINGKFIGNYSIGADNSYASGGAINNHGSITNLTGDFKDNYSSAGFSYGGAIYSNSNITEIKGDYTNNHTEASNTWSGGGAIYNYNGTINKIDGNFKNNYAESTGTYALGGAISNYGTVNDIIGNYINNNVKSTGTYARGGALYNNGTINNIKGDYTGNYAKASGTYALGGAISNYKTIGNLEGNFKNNSAQSSGTNASAGAIYNSSTIEKIKGDFSNNSAVSSKDEALAGAIRNQSGSIGAIEGDFTGNTVSAALTAAGGALWNAAQIGDIKSNFINNSVKTTSKEELAFGGAVYSNRADMQFTADGKQSVFSGNYTQDKRGKINNAIFVRTNKAATDTAPEEFFAPNITLNAKNNGAFLFNDNIDGGEINYEWTELKRNHQYNLKLKGDSSGKVYFNNDIKNANIEHNDVTTTVKDYNFLNHASGEGINSLTMNSGTLNLGNMTLAPLHFETFGMNGGVININSVDVDLANKTMSRITANNYTGEGKGTINVKSMNILSDAEEFITPVKFADKSFKNTVHSDIKEAYTPIYKYDVEYDTKQKYQQQDEDGYFVFKRYERPKPQPQPAPQPKPESADFNPAVLTTPVATQGAAQSAMNNAFSYAFEHSQTFMLNPAMDRLATIRENQYALSTDFNNNLDLGRVRDNAPQGDYANKAIWVKPYTSFESIDLKNGPKVDMISYGTLIGGDSDFRRLRNGWSNVGTLYIGYNGSQMDYKGVDTTTNGGLLGLTETFYKGNFFNATTVSAGAGFAESHTMYGKDDITMFMAGVANKTGYNLEFKEGKFIVQPNLMMSYSMVNTFNYTNSAGVKIKSDPLHTIQLNPSIRFIGNLKHGWQPYASVGMVWNLMNDTKVTANSVKLPEMHTKPYIEYGVGVQKHIGDKFSGYLQAMVRNGGRTGIAFTAGFRWTLSAKDNKKVENKILPLPSGEDTDVSLKNSTAVGEGLNKVSSSRHPERVTVSSRLNADKTVQNKTVIKSRKTDSQRARTLARYNQLIGE